MIRKPIDALQNTSISPVILAKHLRAGNVLDPCYDPCIIMHNVLVITNNQSRI
jgi:hypothetical protein